MKKPKLKSKLKVKSPSEPGPAAAPTPSAPPDGQLAPTAPEKHPGGRETLLTNELQAKIVSFVRAGAWDWVAAEANGVGRRTFFEWMQRGENGHPERPQTDQYAQFVHAVREAHAQARAATEVEVKKTEGLAWLMKGPG